MFSHSEGEKRPPPGLLIANHRGEPCGELQAHLEQQGWQAAVSGDLATTLGLLEGGRIGAVVILPLTLSRDTLEWQKLSPHLSPARPIPWLVIGWAEAPSEALAALTGGDSALAGWMRAPFVPAEVGARQGSQVRIQGLLDESQAREAQLMDQLITDHKTGIFNDRHFRQRLQEEFERSTRHGQPMSVILVDVDDFKAINDRLSYVSGDRVLRAVSAILRRNIRSIDLPARIGGDEFAILLPNTTLGEGVAVASRVREAAGSERIPEDGGEIEFTISAGVAVYEGRGVSHSKELFLEANEALKVAKRAGKNRIYFHDPRTRRPRLEGREELQA